MAKPTPPNEVVGTSREVIESKLLTALEDEGTVAVLFTAEDLKVMILSLEQFAKSASQNDAQRSRSLSLGMAQLYQEAFAS